MCVICIRQPSKTPTSDEQVANWLNNCMTQNPDGAGIAWPTNNGGQFIKGLDDYEDMLTVFKSAPRDVPVVVHFRIGTHGLIDKLNTHPFVISGSGRDADKLAGTGACLMVHNGIIHQMPYSKVKSDTRLLADRLLKLPKEVKSTAKIDIVNAMVGGGKYTFISKSGVKYVGKFEKPTGVEDWLFSNNSYRDRVPIPARYVLPKGAEGKEYEKWFPWYLDDPTKPQQEQEEEQECLFCTWYGPVAETDPLVCEYHRAALGGYDYNSDGYDPSQLDCPICIILDEWDTGHLTHEDVEELCLQHQEILGMEMESAALV